MTVKDMIKNGTTEEQLMNMLKDQIKDAKTAIAAEEAKANKAKENEGKVAAARALAVDAVINYLDVLGVINKDTLDKEDMAEIDKSVKSLENEFVKYHSLMNSLTGLFEKMDKLPLKTSKAPIVKKSTEDLDVDDIITSFLKSLD